VAGVAVLATSVSIDAVLPALTVAGGLMAAVFTALRFNRDDATAVVNQQKNVLDSMKSLNDELEAALQRTREELKEMRAENDVLRAEIRELR
jgi:predicted phage gp36 major capsid-like protein